MVGGQQYKVRGGGHRPERGGGGKKVVRLHQAVVCCCYVRWKMVEVYNAEEREGARPGVANYWIRPRVVLVLQTANSCSFNKNVCKKSATNISETGQKSVDREI